MEELENKLNAIPNSYLGFLAGIISYAEKKPERLKRVLAFIENTDDLSPSDVVKFVMLQPDFREYGLSLNGKC